MKRLYFFLIFSIFGISLAGTVSAATNISATTTDHWAWNDLIGWIDLYTTNSITVSSPGVTGYASSSAGNVYMSCDGSNNPSGCGTVSYGVINDGMGNLSGWAWNDAYGWISFCGGQSTSSCPGTVGYRTLVTASGTRSVFSQWAWNDVIGWLSFNCADANLCGASNYRVATSWIATSTSGTLESSIFDTGVSGGGQLNSVLWRGSQPAGTSVQFQFAASNSSSGPWSYSGPDGTAGSYYTVDVGISLKLDYSLYHNKRYFRYKVTLVSNQAQTAGPRIDDIVVNWSP